MLSHGCNYHPPLSGSKGELDRHGETRALVGFGAGWLIVSFLAVILSITPSPWVETIMGRGTLETHTAALRSTCDRIHRFVGAGEPTIDTGHILAWLADSKKAGEGRPPVGPRDVNDAAGAPAGNTPTN